MKKKEKRGGKREGAGRYPLPLEEKKIDITVRISPNMYKSTAWESEILSQFKKRMENKLKNILT